MELHGHYHRKSMRIPLDIHDFPWSIPWGLGAWRTHVCIPNGEYRGFPLGILSMAIENTWVFHEKSMISLVNTMAFRSMDLETLWI